MKRIVIILYIVVVVVLAAATIVEKYHGTSYVADNIYGAWWFSALWAMLVAVAAFYFIKRKVRRPSVVALHLSFVIILAGALLTHLTSVRGMVHLRQGEPTTRYITKDMRVHQLPFAVTLDRFEIKYYEGTQAPADYLSYVTLDSQPATISMNHIATHRGCRFIQSSYDEDLQGSILAMNSDPWGIPVTYAGYVLLFVSLVWILVDPRGSFRQLLRDGFRRFTIGRVESLVIAIGAAPYPDCSVTIGTGETCIDRYFLSFLTYFAKKPWAIFPISMVHVNKKCNIDIAKLRFFVVLNIKFKIFYCLSRKNYLPLHSKYARPRSVRMDLVCE